MFCGWNSFCSIKRGRKAFAVLITRLAHRPEGFSLDFRQTWSQFHGALCSAGKLHAAQTNPKKLPLEGGRVCKENTKPSPKPICSSHNETSCSALFFSPSLLPRNLSVLFSTLISERVALSLWVPFPGFLALSLPFKGCEMI